MMVVVMGLGGSIGFAASLAARNGQDFLASDAAPEHAEHAEHSDHAHAAEEHAHPAGEHAHPAGETVGHHEAHAEGSESEFLIRVGDYSAALGACRSLSPEASSSDKVAALYREALCLEGLGHWTEAEETYQKAQTAAPALSAADWARCTLGQARCRLAGGHAAAARDLIERVVLRSGDPTCRGQRILEECVFLLACAEVRALPSPRPLDPFDATALAWPSLTGKIDHYLDWLPLGQSAAPGEHSHPSPSAQPDKSPAHTSAKGHAEQAQAQASSRLHPDKARSHEPPTAHTEKAHSHEPPAAQPEKARPHTGTTAQPEKAHPHTSPIAQPEKAHPPTSPNGHSNSPQSEEPPIAQPEIPHTCDSPPTHPETTHPDAPPAVHAEKPNHAAADGWLNRLMTRSMITVDLPGGPLEEHLNAVAKAAGRKLHVDKSSGSKLATPAPEVKVVRAPVGAVLTALCRPAGLSWRMTQDTLTVEDAAAAPEATNRESVINALRLGLALAENHPRARAARITLANLHAGLGQVRAARDQYLRFLDADTHAEEAVYAAFNLGLLELSGGNWNEARARFLDTVDYGPGAHWADHGYWWIGRTMLDQGDTENARKSWLRARGGRTPTTSSAACIGLTACALLDEQTEEAIALSRGFRPARNDTHEALADFLSALLEYRGRPSDLRADKVSQALEAVGEGELLGASGYLLAAQVYREIGRHDRAAGVSDAAGERTHGKLSLRLTFEAAERYDQLDLRAEARKRYAVVAATDTQEFGPKAAFRMANLALRDGRGGECVQRCRTLIGNSVVDQNELLDVMGRGYELLKQYRRAAECFAGRVPAEEPAGLSPERGSRGVSHH
jgi:tetratricopeptide (TPR) repeat protein